MGATLFLLTQHALDRYLDRVGPMPRDTARRTILDATGDARLSRERTKHGQWRWLVPSLQIELICKRDRGCPGWVVVTLWPLEPAEAAE